MAVLQIFVSRFYRFYGLQNFFLLCKVHSAPAIKLHARNENRAHLFLPRNAFLKFHGGPAIIISRSLFRNNHNYGDDKIRESVTCLQSATVLPNFNVPIFFHYGTTHDRKL